MTHIHEQHNLYLFLRLNNSETFVELVGARPLHLLSQTVLQLKSPTGAFIAPLDPIAKLGHFYAVIQCDIVHIKASLLR